MFDTFKIHFTYERLKRILTREFVERNLQQAEDDFNELDLTVREISEKPALMLVGDQMPLLYVMPCYRGLGDYRVYYRIGEVSFDVASIVSMELNLTSDQGIITTMPRTLTEVDSQNLFYCQQVRRRDLTNAKRFLKNVIGPITDEAMKLDQQVRRTLKLLNNQHAITSEFDVPDENPENYE
ncbi:MAG: hypothetical protein ABEK59_07525 [Halobacteria archaeon]